VHPLTRLHRTTIVTRLAARLYLLYKLPAFRRRLRGLPKATEAELSPQHAKAAELILATALHARRDHQDAPGDRDARRRLPA
jgi:hypothetical protein